MSTDPTAATPSYNPLYGDQRFTHPEWMRRNTGAYAPAAHPEGGMVQEIDPNYRERNYSFRDVMESFNPIQHIPVIGHLYRQMTGTQLHPVARVIGGAATGPLGVASAFANVALESATGRDLGGHALQAVAPQRNPANTQLAGGSYIYAPIRDANAPTAPGANDFTANMAQAPQPDIQGPARTARRNRPQQNQDAPPAATPQTVPPADAAAAVAAVQPAAGSAVPPAAFGNAAGQPQQPGILLAQAINAPGAQQATAGRGIQQYITMGGLRPQGGDTQRPVQNVVPARNVPSFRPPGAFPAQAARGEAPAAASDAAAAATAPAAGAVGAGAPGTPGGEATWFSAAMLHGIDRYRDARRTQERETPRVDVSE